MKYGYVPPEERDEGPTPVTEFQQLRDELVNAKPDAPDMSWALPKAKAKAQPAKDEAFEKARASDRASEKRAALGRAGSELAAALGGYKSDTSFWDKMVGDEVSALKARRAAAGKAPADDPAADAAFALAIRQTDPAYADMLEKAGIKLTAKHKDIVWDPLKLKAEQKARADEAAAKAKKAAEDEAAEGAALGDLIKRTFPDQDPTFVDALPLAAKKAMLADRQKQRGEAAAVTRQEDSQKFTAAQTEKKETREDTRASQERFLEGYNLDPEKRPTSKEVQDLRSAQTSTHVIDKTISEIEGLYKQYGTEVLPSAAKARLKSLITDLKLAMKGPEQFALGVLAGPDMELIDKVVPDPTTPRATVMHYLGGSDQTMPQLSALRGQVKRRFAEAAAARGFRPNAAAAPAKVRVKRLSDGKTGTMDANDPALKSGKYEVVNG